MKWTVEAPARLDAFLGAEGRMLSRAKAQTAIDAGRVKVNDKVIRKAAYRLSEGDRVALKAAKEIEVDVSIEPKDLKLIVLYEDDDCLVINKPAGIAVHPGAGMEDDEVTLLSGVAHLFKKMKIPFRSDAVLVHRLDRETTGCLLIAKSPAAHMRLQKQFETRTVEKTYLAIVAGIPSPASATIDAPVGRSTVRRTRMAVHGASAARAAKTTYRTLSSSDDAALLACDLHTGRTHQIRVHLSTIGHPILGDPTYTSAESLTVSRQYKIEDLCLHAWKLSFESKGKRSVMAPVPKTFLAAGKSCGLTFDM